MRTEALLGSAALGAPRIWPQLLPELAERITSFLDHNEVVSTLRLVNKAAAAQFRGPQHTTIFLSRPTPHRVFAARWGAPDAARGLPLKRRLQLLCLTAASGSIPNMEVALEAAGCLPNEAVLQAAAAAGQLEMCGWLMGHEGVPAWRTRLATVLEAAAEGGQRHVCQWLLDTWPERADAEGLVGAACAAIAGGHVDIAEWLLQAGAERFLIDLRRERFDQELHARRTARVLAAAARGCDLPALQRLHREWFEAPAPGGAAPASAWRWPPPGSLSVDQRACVLSAAAGSPTADWRAKLEWLESRGYPRTPDACVSAAGCRDALQRLVWLRQRGWRLTAAVAPPLAAAGDLAALRHLVALEGVRVGRGVLEAARGGHVQVVAWMVETPEAGVPPLGPRLFRAAAESGSVELLCWLHARGCPWDGREFAAAAAGGSEEALEWLAGQGFTAGVGDALSAALRNGDLATLACLRRLSSSWGGRLMEVAVREAALPVIRWLFEAGCPVDIFEARMTLEPLAAARPDGAAVLALFEQHRSRFLY